MCSVSWISVGLFEVTETETLETGKTEAERGDGTTAIVEGNVTMAEMVTGSEIEDET